MTNNFDLNRFNSFLTSAAKTIACGPECQRNKTAQQLKGKYLAAETNLYLAEPQYEIAKKDYYTFISGITGYDDLTKSENKEKANRLADNIKGKFTDEINKIKSQLDTYNSIFINFSNISDLYKQYKIENEKLFKNFKKQSNDVLTNERKTYYQDQEIGVLNNYYTYILWVIYIIIVICYILFSLIYPTTYTLIKRILILILFIILPFISTWLLGKFIKFIYWLFDLLPKNVYH